MGGVHQKKAKTKGRIRKGIEQADRERGLGKDPSRAALWDSKEKRSLIEPAMDSEGKGESSGASLNAGGEVPGKDQRGGGETLPRPSSQKKKDDGQTDLQPRKKNQRQQREGGV